MSRSNVMIARSFPLPIAIGLAVVVSAAAILVAHLREPWTASYEARGDVAERHVVEPEMPAWLRAHEPAGMTELTERAFNSLASSSSDLVGSEGWWRDEAAYEKLSIVQDAAAPASPSSVLQQRLPAGFKGGYAAGTLGASIGSARARQLYVSWAAKWSANWWGHPRSGVNKLFFLGIGGINNMFVFSAQGQEDGPLRPEIRLQNTIVAGGARNIAPNLVPGATISRGEWHRFELVVTANTPGQYDGRVEVWMDGVKVTDVDNVGLVAAGQANVWQEFKIESIWGGMDNVVPADQYLWIDHVYVSGR